MLKLEGIDAGYDQVQVLFDLGLSVERGEVLCMIGRNGAGKTTTARAIMGLVRAKKGQITFDGKRIDRMAAQKIPRLGIGYVPQGRRLFPELSVAENLEIGRMTRRKPKEVISKVLDLFPKLSSRMDQRARTLSGGEQQMLATARALCLEPDVLILDEPTEGLQPSMVELIGDTVRKMREAGKAIILVEQNVEAVLELGDRVAFVEHGTVPLIKASSELTKKSPEFRQYVGIS